MSCKVGQTLASTSTNSDQESMVSWLFNDTTDTCHMLDSKSMHISPDEHRQPYKIRTYAQAEQPIKCPEEQAANKEHPAPEFFMRVDIYCA